MTLLSVSPFSIFFLSLLLVLHSISGSSAQTLLKQWQNTINITDGKIFRAATRADLFMNPLVRANPVPLDRGNLMRFARHPGASVTYLSPRNPSQPFQVWQARGVRAILTRASLNDQTIGSAPYMNPNVAPGWRDIIRNGGIPNRGHLLGKQLGGSGIDVRNIVALYAYANSPVMRFWENKVRGTFNSGRVSPRCRVAYTVDVNYGNPGRLHPVSIDIKAAITNPRTRTAFRWFSVTVPNVLRGPNSRATVNYRFRKPRPRC